VPAVLLKSVVLITVADADPVTVPALLNVPLPAVVVILAPTLVFCRLKFAPDKLLSVAPLLIKKSEVPLPVKFTVPALFQVVPLPVSVRSAVLASSAVTTPEFVVNVSPPDIVPASQVKSVGEVFPETTRLPAPVNVPPVTERVCVLQALPMLSVPAVLLILVLVTLAVPLTVPELLKLVVVKIVWPAEAVPVTVPALLNVPIPVLVMILACEPVFSRLKFAPDRLFNTAPLSIRKSPVVVLMLFPTNVTVPELFQTVPDPVRVGLLLAFKSVVVAEAVANVRPPDIVPALQVKSVADVPSPATAKLPVPVNVPPVTERVLILDALSMVSVPPETLILSPVNCAVPLIVPAVLVRFVMLRVVEPAEADPVTVPELVNVPLPAVVVMIAPTFVF